MVKSYVPYAGTVVTRAEAKAAGLKQFFDGVPCKHGHVSPRYTLNARCKACDAELQKRPKTPAVIERRRQYMRAWYEANLDLHREYTREWGRRNKPKKLARQRKRRSAEGSHTPEDIDAIYKQQKGKCAYCRVKLGASWHVDHIQPVSKGGSNAPRNLQLTCASCNSSKGARDPIIFAQRCGLLL